MNELGGREFGAQAGVRSGSWHERGVALASRALAKAGLCGR